ncbi:hypothetical protein AT6N2_C1154 [Agrobacterium tumefaciens]|nr:hypothetical protein AT6N2_C1154 [Agrobacterium tumefaciens]
MNVSLPPPSGSVAALAENALGDIGARRAAREQLLEEGEVLAARRRGARNRVEDLAVLQRVVGLALDHAILVEIDRENVLLDQRRLHEGGTAHALLRDVIEHLVAERRGRGGRAHGQQHLLAARTLGDQLERLLVHDVAVVENICRAGAGGKQTGCEHDCNGGLAQNFAVTCGFLLAQLLFPDCDHEWHLPALRGAQCLCT